jgi:uncharacterized protein YdaU (DUF1376 family)
MNAHSLPLYPSAYLADTVGLSCCEHGVYFLLLAVSWQRGPLPDDMDHLSRLTASPPVEALRHVLEEYWTLSDRGWINARLETERAKLEAIKARKSSRARKAAEARWSKTCLSNASAMHKHCSSIGELSTGSKIPPCPHKKIIELYHQHCPRNPEVRSWEGQRPKYLQARWKSHPELEWWDGFLQFVGKSDFLTGRKAGSRGPFRPGLDWMIRPENFQKICEGHYNS